MYYLKCRENNKISAIIRTLCFTIKEKHEQRHVCIATSHFLEITSDRTFICIFSILSNEITLSVIRYAGIIVKGMPNFSLHMDTRTNR